MARWKPDAQGRLMVAAMQLFDEQGYEATTVAQIAERAELTKRTFFRHFADKREVLFHGSQDLQRLWVEGLRAAPAQAGPLATVMAGLDPVAEMFAERHEFAGVRARLVAANPELMERELIKLQSLVDALAAALVARRTPPTAARLAAQTGVAVFHEAFARWVAQPRATALRELMDDALAELRAVLAEEAREPAKA